jgi:imidazolonepropionase-like amidohydrolase
VSQRKVKDVLEAGLSSLEIARDAGVAMGFGTDLLGETHEQQSREFAIRGEVLDAALVLRSATLTNARILGQEGELGEVAVGARADLLVVEGNPLDDVGLLSQPDKSVRAVVKDGMVALDRLDG